MTLLNTEPYYLYHYKLSPKKTLVSPSLNFALTRSCDGEVLVEEMGKGIIKKIELDG